MNAALRVPPDDVPTLTEVLRPSDLVATGPPVDLAVDAERLVLQIVGDIQDRAEVLLQAGLRERLPPLLDQLVRELLATLVRDVREEVLPALQDTVRQAVAEELARTRLR
jgi:hypothetical protein